MITIKALITCSASGASTVFGDSKLIASPLSLLKSVSSALTLLYLFRGELFRFFCKTSFTTRIFFLGGDEVLGPHPYERLKKRKKQQNKINITNMFRRKHYFILPGVKIQRSTFN